MTKSDLTPMETAILNLIKDSDWYDGECTWLDIPIYKSVTDYTNSQIKGVLSSLVKKNLITICDSVVHVKK